MTQAELDAITVETEPGSTVKVAGEIPFSYLAKHRAASVKHISKDMEIDGFRKGHVPEKVLVDRVGEMAILNEMAERALAEVYPDIVKTKALDVIGYPQIAITKIAADNPLGFSATIAVVPEVTLPDYKAIAAKANKSKESKDVTKAEVQKQVEEVLRQKVAHERMQEKAAKKADGDAKAKDLGGATELPTPDTVSAADEDDVDPEKLPLPELTDEYAKTLGQPGQFETADDFKAKLKEHLAIQKAQDVDAKHRAKITDAIIDESKMELPSVLVDAELNQMFAQMEDDLTRAQLTMDDYLNHIKKTKDDMKEEWAPAAEKRAKLQLVLNEISKREDIKPDAGKVDHEVSHLLETHKDADEARVRVYVESILSNDAVMKLLEEAK